MFYLKEELTVGLVNFEKNGIYLSSVDFELLSVLEMHQVEELTELNLLKFHGNGSCLEVDFKEFQQLALSQIPNYQTTMLLDINYIIKKYYQGYIVANLNLKFVDGTTVNYSTGELTVVFNNNIAFKNFAKYALSLYGFKPLSVLDQLIINNNAYCELEKPDSVIYMHDHING